ncbi:PREDICTED: nucleolar MIF4G domain-containing protein 1-like [Amphimedon queenslandica]|uniref:MIF4G domain-containing protein n=1 Tax=Amphimedon queenslandica TaxID=400682 RepID=A0AAN0JCX1_AMPQE|nr:PREDICTED: nucleolar MIF4G domain-containing protein 1-like [Amphimedon queenslandica]|eukprot:XP_019854558.1 PREDICTED: nucleolar MIF4G domain-containing protein 1-like [Amphimedon queenslandica]
MEEETEEIEKEDISLGESSEGDGDVQKKKKVTFAPETFVTQNPSTSSSIPTSSSSPNVNKRIQGLMNKLNESNIQTMFTTIEELYRENSQREVTKCFCEVFLKSVIQPILIKDKFAMELVMLVTLLHQKIGSEVGFAVLSQLVKKLNELLSSPSYGKGKECDCLLLVISHLYNFKVVQCVLIYDIIRKLLDSLTERDLDLLVLILKTCGMEIRRNDSLALKDVILDIQTKARTLNEDNSSTTPEEQQQQEEDIPMELASSKEAVAEKLDEPTGDDILRTV